MIQPEIVIIVIIIIVGVLAILSSKKKSEQYVGMLSSSVKPLCRKDSSGTNPKCWLSVDQPASLCDDINCMNPSGWVPTGATKKVTNVVTRRPVVQIEYEAQGALQTKIR